MSSSQLFHRVCQQIAQMAQPDRADLHIHSTHSDGEFTPAEIVQRAIQAKLTAVAITDHDTLCGYHSARQAAQTTSLQIIPGVELTCEYRGIERHLLGYFFQLDHRELNATCRRIQQQRCERFQNMAWRLQSLGASISSEAIEQSIQSGSTLGRRHLAMLLVRQRFAGTVYDAFQRYLCQPEVASAPKFRLPIEQGILLIQQAGGVSSWAHPPQDVTEEQLLELRSWGLQAIECEYPWPKKEITQRLRTLARKTGLQITGGSDCHGPTPVHRAIGHRGITNKELLSLRAVLDSAS